MLQQRHFKAWQDAHIYLSTDNNACTIWAGFCGQRTTMNNVIANTQPWEKKANNRLHGVEASTFFTKGDFFQVIHFVWI